VKLPRLPVADALAGHARQITLRGSGLGGGATSPVPKGEGPGAPSAGLSKITETGATRLHPPLAKL
jgi:hypothetical protein